MKEKTLLTIIIPVYNVEKYIKKTLDSIFDQFFPQDEVEIIVVNDGTPDNSMQIVEEFGKKHNNLHIINQQNKGLSGARNTGLKAAQGNYIWFVDSDDWLEKGSLINILNLLRTATEDVFIFRIKEYDEKGNVIFERSHPYEYEYRCSGIKCIKNEQFDCTPVQIYIIKNAFLRANKLSFVEGLIHEDIEFAPRMLIAAKTVVFAQLFSYCYLRRTSGNITSDISLSPQRLKSLVFLVDRFENLANQTNNQEEKEIYFKRQTSVVLGVYYRATEQMMSNNAEGIMDRNYIKKCKSIVLRNLRHEKNLNHIVRQMLFLLSVRLYHRIMVQRFMK